jgi:uncharacterized protein HemY
MRLIIIFAVIFFLAFIIIMIGLLFAPRGWEDRRGYHKAKNHI